MKIAVMQPYFFPYIGYFQLIQAVDKFIFYDDVNFIKSGWINRNRILLNNHATYITVQLKGASSFKHINSVEFTDNRGKLKKTIEHAYKKAPYFNSVWAVIIECLDFKTNLISELAIHSVMEVSKYLTLNTLFEISSINYPETRNMDKAERLKELCKVNSASQYINPIGGTILYNKNDFATIGINLSFLKSKNVKYIQSKNEFVPWLSIIDIMMFNSVEMIKQMLNNYELI